MQRSTILPRGKLFGDAVHELVRHRVLVWSLASRQLKARYRGSVLGFLWTILNPLLLMAVYTLVFRYYVRIDVPNYALFLLCGLLPWTFFASSLSEGVNSIVSGGTLVTKSLFPPHVLPTVTVVSQLVNFVLSLPLLFGLMAVYGVPLGASLLALPVVVVLQAAFTWGLTLTVAAVNVHFRDVQHVLASVLALWFFLCPIVYTADHVPPELRLLLAANPMALVVTAYQAILLDGALPNGEAMATLAGFAAVAVAIGLATFERFRDSFAELV